MLATEQATQLSLAYRFLCAAVSAYGINSDGTLVPQQPYYDAVGFLHPPTVFVAGEDDINACLVGTSEEGVILAFRGTNTPATKDLKRWLDWINDAQIEPIAVPNMPGKVHAGFWSALDSLWVPMVAELKKQTQANGKQLPLYITGHSKGGALSSLAAFRLATSEGITPTGVYTFASPHPGDLTFTKQYQATIANHIRYEFGDDIVPYLVPDEVFMNAIAQIPALSSYFKATKTWDYVPVGTLKFIKWDKKAVVADSVELKAERLARLVEALVTLRFEEIIQAHSALVGGGYMDGASLPEVIAAVAHAAEITSEDAQK